jgi:NMD protein affecting ribosome stability and mRNA decay
MNQSDSHLERIICPMCDREQRAEVLHAFPFDVRVHTCNQCGYVIMESEWERVWEEEEGDDE